MKQLIMSSVALQTFALIFLAEMADKTQLMTITLAAQHRKPLWVFVGAASALVLVTLIGVIFGEAITRVVPARRIHQIGGVIFIVLGALMLFGRE